MEDKTDERLFICEISADGGATWTNQWLRLPEIDEQKRMGYQVRMKP